MSSKPSHFFAYISRLRLIQRWGLMYNVHPENVQEHSVQVSFIAHMLAVIKNRIFGGEVDPARTALLAMYHDTSEVITGDLPTPIKYFSPQIKKAYKEIEQVANVRLFQFLPDELKGEFTSIFFSQEDDRDHWALVKAADKISAYLKCVEELKAGNQEFAKAGEVLHKTIEELSMPEVKYFMEVFLPSMELTLDELE
ncbi:MAG: 5'-deoxynucleotidase [Bacteroidota bacterium]